MSEDIVMAIWDEDIQKSITYMKMWPWSKDKIASGFNKSFPGLEFQGDTQCLFMYLA